MLTTRPVMDFVPFSTVGWSTPRWVNPTKTWCPGGPNSWKNGGSAFLIQASSPFVPSMVEVCVQSEPAGGRMWMVYLAGNRFRMSAVPWESVVTMPLPGVRTFPSAS